MPRYPKILHSRYGKLSVISETVKLGRRMAKVKCSCGVVKEVYCDALFDGRTRSCGAQKCRGGYSPVKRQAGYRPRGPRTMTMETLEKYWVLYKSGTTATQVADDYAENPRTLFALFRSIRRAGGWSNYSRKVPAQPQDDV